MSDYFDITNLKYVLYARKSSDDPRSQLKNQVKDQFLTRCLEILKLEFMMELSFGMINPEISKTSINIGNKKIAELEQEKQELENAIEELRLSF